MPRNLRTTLPRRRARSMNHFDALPPDLRAWLRDAALPFSTTAALRIWTRHGPNPAQARAALDRAQSRAIQKDASWPSA